MKNYSGDGADKANYIPPVKNTPQRARLVALTGPNAGEQLVFHYNPGSWNDSREVEWAEISIPGGLDPVYQFVAGGVREIELELFFDEYKVGNRIPPMSVEDSIRFLQRSCEPVPVRVNQFSFKAAPPIMLFLWGNIKFDGRKPGLICIISSVKVERMFFKPVTHEAIRATAEVTLKKFRPGVLA